MAAMDVRAKWQQRTTVQTAGNLDALGPLIQKAYSLVDLGSDAASGLTGISGQRGRP